MPSTPRTEKYLVLNINQESSETEQFVPGVLPEVRGALTVLRYQDINAATEDFSVDGGSLAKTVQIDSDNVLVAIGMDDEELPSWQRLLTAEGKQIIDGAFKVLGVAEVVDGGLSIKTAVDPLNTTFDSNTALSIQDSTGTVRIRIQSRALAFSVNQINAPSLQLVNGTDFAIFSNSGVSVTTPKFEVDGATGNTSVAGTLSVDGKISDPGGINTFDDDVTIEGNATVNGTLSVDGKISDPGGTNVFDDDVTVEGKLSVGTNRIMQVVDSSATTETKDWAGITTEETYTTTVSISDPPSYGAGDVFRFTIYGSYTRTGTPNLTLRAYFGGTLCFSTGAVAVAANGDFAIHIVMRRGTGGGSTNHRCTGTAYMGASPGAPTVRFDNRQVSGQGNSGAKSLSFSAQFSAASASNTVSLDNMILESSAI